MVSISEARGGRARSAGERVADQGVVDGEGGPARDGPGGESVISLAESRRLLGRLAEGKSDEDVAAMREAAYARVRSLVHAFRERQKHNGPGARDAEPVGQP